MPEIINNSHFEPSSNTRQTWLGTRKNSFTCGNQEFPGFYQTSGISKDWGWVSLALIIEVIAILLTIFGGFTKGGMFLFGAVIIALLFIVLDYIGVLFHHEKQEERTKWRSEFLITDQVTIPILSKKLNKRYAKEMIGVLSIVFSSILKVFAVYVLLGTVLSEIMILILSIFYLLVIYIHLSHTGFVVWEVKTSIKVKKDYEKYAKSHEEFKKGQLTENQIYCSALVRSTPFEEINFKLNNIEIDKDLSIGEHKIRLIKEEGGIYYYEIETKGILLDSHIRSLCSGQNTNQARFIGLQCLRHQFINH